MKLVKVSLNYLCLCLWIHERVKEHETQNILKQMSTRIGSESKISHSQFSKILDAFVFLILMLQRANCYVLFDNKFCYQLKSSNI